MSVPSQSPGSPMLPPLSSAPCLVVGSSIPARPRPTKDGRPYPQQLPILYTRCSILSPCGSAAQLPLDLLDQRQHVAHVEDAAGDTVRMEHVQAFRLFADTDELDRLAGDVAHAQRGTATGVAVGLGLNDLFKRFDTRATSLGLEKIKTIGDAYMVAGGLPTNDDEHAIRVTKMALGMYEDLEAFNKEHGMELDMRIGINSGPVVAGVIGHSKFSYDLWGNTVNTASRMESTCLPGKVQVSPSTYEQIKGHFDVQENQVIECKGLGQIMTYFVK